MQTHSSPAPTRRTLLTASTWSVPAVVLASAAPAFANSRPECQPMSYALNWGQTGAWSYNLTGAQIPGNGEGQILASPVVQPGVGQVLEPLPIIFTNTFYGQKRRAGDFTEGNMIVTAPGVGVGGTGARGLEMWQRMGSTSSRNANAVHNDRQTITFDFGRQVTNLSFTITDIDAYQTNSSTGQYRDAVYVSQPPTSVALGARVTGAGTQSSPWTPNVNTSTNSALDNTTDGRGNVRLTYAGPIQALSVTFYNAETRALASEGSQAIYFTNFNFTANSCV